MLENTILTHFSDDQRVITLQGCDGSYLALIMARLVRTGRLSLPLVVLTPDEDSAQGLAGDLSFFLGDEDQGEAGTLPRVMHLPAIETSPYVEISFDRAAMMSRMGVLFRLSQGYQGEILVASASAWRRRVMPRRAFVELCDLYQAEEEVDREAAITRLVACGYNRAQVVEDPGTFSVRGGILDLFPPLSRYPFRLEFFSDLVESIRLFDPVSQRTLRPIPEVVIHPVRETIPTGQGEVRGRILQAADAVNYPSSRTRALLEEVASGREFFGIEAITPAFHDELEPVSAYLPPGVPLLVVDPEGISRVFSDEDSQSERAFAARLAEGRLTFPPGDFFVPQTQLAEEMARHPRILACAAEESGAVVSCPSRDNSDLALDLRRAQSERGEQILKTLAARLRRWQAADRPVVIAAGGKGQRDRLEALLKGYGVICDVRDEPGTPDLLAESPAGGAVQLQPGELRSGFRLAEGLVVLAEEEIFGPKARKRRTKRLAGPGLGDLRELREGEHIVHAEHGIGLYQGLVKLDIKGVPADYLRLEYAGGDRLYLPVYRMNLVQKFSGADGPAPRLDRMGGATWDKKRSRVKKDVRKLAEELLQLYAQRASLSGYAFPPPDAAFNEFEATFPFSETPDQLQAVQDVQEDLAAPRPMDRLICGDVGFGKTEVALRAAFIAAMSGKQVALLAPTTVLVEQHCRTFTDRMKQYPLRVESLSRFRNRAEVRTVLADMALGRVDITIGTHRLLSSDVRFKDLGLLIIDEEQRFGVTHKEKLKRLRTQVDVITLTATPIPRTLQMSMMGMREISIIATPPVDRLAIRTFVSRYDDALVEEGITKELDRGGQVFFVHNRVDTIDQWAARIAALVPRARIAVAHGQMEPAKLERVMVDFVSGQYDILICTTIIESGLDIPRANTMFVNRADCFGLAQLYQLRGRIGRSRHRAFCYLMVPGLESMSDDARQRLNTLQRFTELGSGFSIASHDLEIRGAGDLLGAKQSGCIAAVGFETYGRILEEAVAEIKGEAIIRESDPELNTRVPAFIPDDYVEDTGQRLELYKRLSNAATDEDAIGDLLAEMRDRYGERPQEVDALGELMVLKGLASALGASVLDLTETRLSLTLSENTPLDPDTVIPLVSDKHSGFKLTPEMRLIRTLRRDEQRSPMEAAKKILHGLLAHANQPH